MEKRRMRQPQVAFLADGRRLHLQDGPIDLVIEAFGDRQAVATAYIAAVRRFTGLLDELVTELPLLRAQAHAAGTELTGVVARRMHAAVTPFAAECFITPMAAVAGAVADEILRAMQQAAPLARAYVNNGGDIALHLQGAESFVLGLVNRPDRPSLFARAKIAAQDPSRGIATSGWRGRSFSLGIADAVTILAATAAQADAAATIVANAVDLPGHPAIERAPAAAIAPDSDLGGRLVTRAVGSLAPAEVEQALAHGLARAGALRDRGLIHAAAIRLQGETSLLVPDDGAAPRLSPTSSAASLQREIAHV
jgi:ApbE superfamily uncharacterized protein (UPF0280 family)